MSAFICDDAHITALAVYATRNGLAPNKTPQQIGDMLHAENVRSVNVRYKENTKPDFAIDEGAAFTRFEPVQILKAAYCLDYQSCEHSAWESSEAFRLLNAIAEHAKAAFPPRYRACDPSQIPGYEAAVWEITPGTYDMRGVA